MLTPPRKILVRGVNWLGDSIMSMPALARLREAHPEARITLLTPEAWVDLWRRHSSLDALISFRPGESPWRIGQRLRGEKFDLGLAFPNSPRAALELALARIPKRIGYARPWRNWLLTDLVSPRAEEVVMRKRSAGEIRRLSRQAGPVSLAGYPSRAHHVYQYLELVAAAGATPQPLAPQLVVAPREVEAMRKKFLPPAASPAQWLGMSPGAAYGPAKRWPVDRFIDAASAVQRQTGCGWIVLGGPGERPVAAEIARGLREASGGTVLDLSGKTTLGELCAVFRLCQVALGNDSGPMHLAAAVGTPVVVLFGSTASELTSPGDPSQATGHLIVQTPVACTPCFRRDCPIDLRCLHGIQVTRVVEAVLKLVSRSSALVSAVGQSGP